MSILTVNIHTGITDDEFKSLKRRVKRLEQNMTVFDDEIAQLNEVTNLVADRVQNLIDQVASLTGAQADAVKAAADQLVPFVEHLRQIGTDPNQPLPPTPDAPPVDDGSGATPVDGGTSTIDGASRRR